LNACLLDADAAQRAFEKRTHRSGLFLSLTIQAAAVALLLLFPLLGKPAPLVGWRGYPVLVPPRGQVEPARLAPPHHVRANRAPPLHSLVLYAPTHVPTAISTADTHSAASPVAPDVGTGNGPEGAAGVPDSIGTPLAQPVKAPDLPRVIRVAHLDSAMLLHRTEPVYPVLALQIRRQGRVELHALIAADGAIQSLEVVSGDSLFTQSALDAVRQWRYRPTLLNGQPVAVDTYITVVYSLNQ
jgi:protein TonB